MVSKLYLGYHTNSLTHHALRDAAAIVAELGYRGVAITIDHHALDPRERDRQERIETLRRRLEDLRLRSVIETGARFLLDPWRKHEPTLVSPEAEGRLRRRAFYEYAIDVAAALGSDCVSLWSGRPRAGTDPEQATRWLVEGLQFILDYADERGVVIGFEPEPGMLIDSMFRFEQLVGRIDSPRLRLTLDVGHLHCQGETPISQYIHAWASRLVCVHLDDARGRVHEHLMPGEGEIDFAAVLAALAEVDYRGGAFLELNRHSREGPEAARRAIEFLRGALPPRTTMDPMS